MVPQLLIMLSVNTLAARRGEAKKCEATNVDDFDDHDGTPGISLFPTTMKYKCGLTRDNTKGYKFCKACSEADECPICGGGLQP